jgi:histidinol-phosphate aminotransferase
MSPRPRPEILTIAAYVGGVSKLPGHNHPLKLSSNEGAFGVPPGVLAVLHAVMTEAYRYPDGSSAELRAALGRFFDLDPAQIVCGAGSDDIIYQLCLAYGGAGTELIMTAHGFAIYEIAGIYAGSKVIRVPERNLTTDVDAILAAVTQRTTLVFIANPNNPTGSMIDKTEVERLRQGLPADVLLVLDAAYAEYVDRTDYDAGIDLVSRTDNTVMTRTFSKIFGMGGLRLGWCFAPPGVTDVLNRVRGPFNCSVPALAAGVAALAEPGWIERLRAHNTQWRAWTDGELRRLGLKVWPSEANFLLVDFGTPDRAKAADANLRSQGVIVRGVASYGLPQCLRVTIGTEDECRALVAAMARFVDQAGG